MKSEICVSHGCDEPVPITNLIAHHGITVITNQTAEIICILGIVEETLNSPLICQWTEFLENGFQLPISTCWLDPNSTSEGAGSPFQLLPPHSFLAITFRNRYTEGSREGLDPGC